MKAKEEAEEIKCNNSGGTEWSSQIRLEEYSCLRRCDKGLLTYNDTRRSRHYVPILIAPAEGWGALLGAFSPLLSSSIQNYNLRPRECQ